VQKVAAVVNSNILQQNPFLSLVPHFEGRQSLFAKLVTGDKSWFYYHTMISKGNPFSGNMAEVLGQRNFKQLPLLVSRWPWLSGGHRVF
jgi:hypothetical protein